MRRKSVKPSEYPALPFHIIRFTVFVSSLVVAIILAVFAYNLHNADQKFPWAFLIVSLNSRLLSSFVLSPSRSTNYVIS